MSHPQETKSGIQPLACPVCQSTIVTRMQRSLLTKWFSNQKHYICRACYSTFRENGSIIKARKASNPVIQL